MGSERVKYDTLIKMWVKGLNLDWTKLYGKTKPRRISLPTYPFAKERYWINESASENHKSKFINHKSPWLHPLVHENTSNFEEQRFSSTFTGGEFFLKDHQVKGEKILPAVAYLELARAALKEANGQFDDNKHSIRLKNVAWASPIVVTQATQVHIAPLPRPRQGHFLRDLH